MPNNVALQNIIIMAMFLSVINSNPEFTWTDPNSNTKYDFGSLVRPEK